MYILDTKTKTSPSMALIIPQKEMFVNWYIFN